MRVSSQALPQLHSGSTPVAPLVLPSLPLSYQQATNIFEPTLLGRFPVYNRATIRLSETKPPELQMGDLLDFRIKVPGNPERQHLIVPVLGQEQGVRFHDIDRRIACAVGEDDPEDVKDMLNEFYAADYGNLDERDPELTITYFAFPQTLHYGGVFEWGVRYIQSLFDQSRQALRSLREYDYFILPHFLPNGPRESQVPSLVKKKPSESSPSQTDR
jgi:hypothetical protein